jgi:hypothetical protein
MKLHFIATGDAPERYSFSGDTITAEKNGQSESWNLSGLQAGGKFQGITVDTLSLSPGHVIRDAYRDSGGELHVTLCQAVGANDWTEQDGEIDAADYDPAVAYVQLVRIKRNGEDVADYEPQWSSERSEWVAVKKETD